MDDDVLGLWDRAARAYSESRRDGPLSESEAIYGPALDELVGEVAGRRILDAGCGDGHHARALSARGARVTAVDGAPAMLALAGARSPDPRIRYVQADLLAPLPFRDASHDLVVSTMVLMDLHRIDVTIAEIARVLVRGGGLVFSITHPAFYCSDWVVVDGVKRHKAVADYLTPRAEAQSFWGRTLHFHRPLGDYVDELGRHGLAIVALREPRPSPDQMLLHPEWERHLRIPSFLVARALRL